MFRVNYFAGTNSLRENNFKLAPCRQGKLYSAIATRRGGGVMYSPFPGYYILIRLQSWHACVSPCNISFGGAGGPYIFCTRLIINWLCRRKSGRRKLKLKISAVEKIKFSFTRFKKYQRLCFWLLRKINIYFKVMKSYVKKFIAIVHCVILIFSLK